jgi:hypothetical protein
LIIKSLVRSSEAVLAAWYAGFPQGETEALVFNAGRVAHLNRRERILQSGISSCCEMLRFAPRLVLPACSDISWNQSLLAPEPANRVAFSRSKTIANNSKHEAVLAAWYAGFPQGGTEALVFNVGRVAHLNRWERIL